MNSFVAIVAINIHREIQTLDPYILNGITSLDVTHLEFTVRNMIDHCSTMLWRYRRDYR